MIEGVRADIRMSMSSMISEASQMKRRETSTAVSTSHSSSNVSSSTTPWIDVDHGKANSQAKSGQIPQPHDQRGGEGAHLGVHAGDMSVELRPQCCGCHGKARRGSAVQGTERWRRGIRLRMWSERGQDRGGAEVVQLGSRGSLTQAFGSECSTSCTASSAGSHQLAWKRPACVLRACIMHACMEPPVVCPRVHGSERLFQLFLSKKIILVPHNLILYLISYLIYLLIGGTFLDLSLIHIIKIN